jgi:hypothetical protein
VYWDKRDCKWAARIKHERKQKRKGTFHTEEEAARAFDDAARELRGSAAQSGKFSLNFPTVAEKQEAAAAVEPAKPAASAATTAAAAPARSSKYVGVHWVKRDCKWAATIKHEGKQGFGHSGGQFIRKRQIVCVTGGC